MKNKILQKILGFIFCIKKSGEINRRCSTGQILTELIIAIAITVILAAIGAQLIGVSLYSAGSSEERQTATRLAEEVFEALRAISQGNDASSQGWNRFYLPPDGSGNESTSKGIANQYKIIVSASSTWEIANGSSTITLEGKDYNRYFIIENVSRDSSGAIESVYNSSNDDPHTQKATVYVFSPNGEQFAFSEYFSRYLNESTAQTNWSDGSGQCGPYGATSSVSGYCSQSNIDTSGGGNFKLQAQ
ncbi:MAG: hypothetical protein AAB405_02490 [Patescibacteria group bacterium]